MNHLASLLLAAVTAWLAVGCEREQRRFDTPPSPVRDIGAARASGLRPGPSASASAGVSTSSASSVSASAASGVSASVASVVSSSAASAASIASSPDAGNAASAPASHAARARDDGANPHEQNAFAVTQGKRLFRWYNCSGCHANGGGGMGPPLMDDQWLYGSEPRQIVATILLGRPNGMPSFAGRIPEEHAWQIAAYVRSMSGQLRTDVAPSRGDSLSSGGPPETRRDRLTPKAQEPGS